MRSVLAVVFCFVSSVALAQTAVQQNGAVSQFDMPRWNQDHRVESAGGIFGKNGRGVNPFTATDNKDLAFCARSGLSTAAHNALCFGHDANGNGLLTLDPVNGDADRTMYLRKNGTLYEFPFTGAGGGNMVGPSNTAVNNAISWNNITGSLVKDVGAPPGIKAPTNVAMKALTRANSNGAVVHRTGFTSESDGPELAFVWSAGTCASRGMTDDGASCVDASDGNSLSGIFPGKLDARWFGASPAGATNTAPAMNAAMAYSIAHANMPIVMSPGRYMFSTPITATLTAAGQNVDISGDGPDSTIMYWPAGGGMAFTAATNRNAFHFKGMAFVTGGTNVGTAISIDQGTQHNEGIGSTTFDRVIVRGDTVATNYWATNVKLNGIGSVNFNNFDSYGDTTGGAAGSHNIGLDLTAPNTNLSVIYNISNSNFFGSLYGIRYGANIQGVQIVNTNLTLNNVGIKISTGPGMSQLAVTNSQLANIGANIQSDPGDGLQNILISNNLFFVYTGGYGIRLQGNNGQVQISNNQFVTTTGGLMSGTAISMEGTNPFPGLITDTLCIDIATCVNLGAATSKWHVSGLHAPVSTVSIANAGTANTIKGFVQSDIEGYVPATRLITGAANNGAGKIRLTLSTSVGLVTGETVFVGPAGILNTPGIYNIIVIDGTHVDLDNSAFGGTFAAGGLLSVLP